MSKKIKVLIVEDSKSQQLLLRQIINSDPELEVVGIADNGLQAIEMINISKPDAVTMDILMPGMNGFQTIKTIMATTPVPIVVVSAKANSDDKQVTFNAIESGALAIIGKPPGFKDPAFEEASKELRDTLKTIAKAKNFGKDDTSYRFIRKKPEVVKQKLSRIKAIAIGTSLGGPQALKELLSNISPSISVPIFIVQHISSGFSNVYAQWLDASSILPVSIPLDGTKAQPGHVYLAPDNRHMVIDKHSTIHLLEEENPKAITPSVGKLLSSVAIAYGADAIGVILTGMGEDGSNELLAMREKGAVTIAQDQSTALAFGMPGTAINLGGAKFILGIKEIAPFLNKALE